MKLHATLERLPRWVALLVALAVAVVVGWVDYITGWEWTIFVFYALPITLVVWRAGFRLGLAFAVLCTGIWFAAQIPDNPYRTSLGLGVAGVSRFCYFVVVVVAVVSVRARRELDRSRIETLERARELEREILRAGEREQQRIGRDLHDSLGPHLAAIGYATTFLANELRLRGHSEAAKAEQIRGLVGEAIALSRDLARGLFPVQMDGTGLASALEDLSKTTSRLTGMKVAFFETGDTQVNDPETGMNLYRIAQEALNNAAKHGEAKNVTIILSKGDGTLSLVIADDGKGMPVTPNGSRGMGLHSMKYRARSLGGEIDLKSGPGEGTVVRCEIPLRPPLPSNKTP